MNIAVVVILLGLIVFANWITQHPFSSLSKTEGGQTSSATPEVKHEDLAQQNDAVKVTRENQETTAQKEPKDAAASPAAEKGPELVTPLTTASPPADATYKPSPTIKRRTVYNSGGNQDLDSESARRQYKQKNQSGAVAIKKGKSFANAADGTGRKSLGMYYDRLWAKEHGDELSNASIVKRTNTRSPGDKRNNVDEAKEEASSMVSTRADRH